MQTITLASGEELPAFGQGTWTMGHGGIDKQEVEVLRKGFEYGLTVVDTAEMYGPAERVVGEAVGNDRDKIFVVSKVSPENASYEGTLAACSRSLKQLKMEQIDLYLLHWRGRHPLKETVRAFEELRADGRIRYWGVSNLDIDDMQEIADLDAGSHCAANQVLYHLDARGIEWDLLPYQQRQNIVLMAYTPLGRGQLMRNPVVQRVAERHGVSPAALCLAWTLRLPGVMTIPKTSTLEHLEENRRALEVKLTDQDIKELDAAYPPPSGPEPLDTA